MSGGAKSILRHFSRIAQPRSFAPRYAINLSYSAKPRIKAAPEELEDEKAAVPTEGINRPLSEVLKKLNMKIPDSLICTYVEKNGVSLRYVPWHTLNRLLNLHAPEWSGEVRSIVYSPEGNKVSVVYRVTLHGTDSEIYREATGTSCVDDTTFGDPVQKAEAMAFRRACARLGLGLQLYPED
ncbi:cobalt ion binding protein [Carex rostrata]